MTKKPESRLQKSIRKTIKDEFGGWGFKVWGGPFTKAGIPDWVGTVDGVFIALEVKRPVKSSKPSALQLEVISEIVWQGRGYATTVRSKEEAVCAILAFVAQAKRSLGVRVVSAGSGVALRTARGKDLHNISISRETYLKWLSSN